MVTWMRWGLVAAVLSAGLAGAQVDERKGVAAEPNKHYTLGKEAKWDVVFKGAEYSLDRVVVDTDVAPMAKANKRVVLHFSVQNALPQEQSFNVDSLPVTLIDTAKASHDGEHWWWVEGRNTPAFMPLKQAQRLELATFIDLPASAVPTKLLVLPGAEEGLPILRYALTGKIKPLTANLADPADKTGATPLDSLPAAKGEWFQFDAADAKVIDWGELKAKIPDQELTEGKHWFAVSVALRNGTNSVLPLYGGSFLAKLVLEDETEVALSTGLALKALKPLDIQLSPKAETAIRLVFELAKDDKPAKLSLCDELEKCRIVKVPLAAK